MESLKKILLLLEDILRGRAYDDVNIVEQSRDFFNWANSFNDAIIDSVTRADMFKHSIALHNKLRALPVHLAEMRSYLKGASGWLLFKLGDMKPASVGQYIKVFLRAGSELVSFSREGEIAALICFNQAIESWELVIPSVFERSLNPIDFSELKSSLVMCFLDKLKLLFGLKPRDYLKDMRKCVSSALEIVQHQQFFLMLTFSKSTASIGHHYSLLMM